MVTINSTPTDKRDAAYTRVCGHIESCTACQHPGGVDAPRSHLCPRGQALYALYELAIDKARRKA